MASSFTPFTAKDLKATAASVTFFSLPLILGFILPVILLIKKNQ
ncbi:hypothetical protein [Calothrix rhizosoleniae]|nr:hypothetical protein [Calothrix rhizosoleniae]